MIKNKKPNNANKTKTIAPIKSALSFGQLFLRSFGFKVVVEKPRLIPIKAIRITAADDPETTKIRGKR